MDGWDPIVRYQYEAADVLAHAPAEFELIPWKLSCPVCVRFSSLGDEAYDANVMHFGGRAGDPFTGDHRYWIDLL